MYAPSMNGVSAFKDAMRAVVNIIAAGVLLIFSYGTVLASSDDYIRGYCEAVLENQFQLTPASLTVDNGVITLIAEGIHPLLKEQLRSRLQQIRGVTQVMILESVPDTRDMPVHAEKGPPASTLEKERSQDPASFYEKKHLFEPLVADPRWPRFSIAYQVYLDDDELKNVGATSFGATLPFYTDTAPLGGDWQVGLQASVFALFDLDASSHDLINADYWVGIPLSYRRDAVSAMLRLFHQSSHLGDEFLLRSRVDRVNLSYEALDFKVSYDYTESVRGYGGSGYIVRKEPDDLKRWSLQYGIEWKSSDAYFNNLMKPVAGADFKHREESDWNVDMSLRGGIVLESDRMFWNRLNLMIEYFYGFSPHGQFYDRRIEYLSLGTHFFF